MTGGIRLILTEDHFIRRKKKTEQLYRRIDDYCYNVKNLYNSVNYLIVQCGRISRKLAAGEATEPWEDDLLSGINSAVSEYNAGREGKKQLEPVSGENSFIADAYFLSWHMKSMDVYKALPYAKCGQICIQNVCRNWKSFYESLKAVKENPEKFMGYPKRPGYLDKKTGRSPLILTKQNVSTDEKGNMRFPKFLQGVCIKVRHREIHQVRILTEAGGIRIQVMYEQAEKSRTTDGGVMAIDPGINNLMAISMNQDCLPVIISGRPVKSINQYYNKKKAFLQSEAKKKNRRHMTSRMQRLSGKRNRKIKDYMHKASCQVIRLALENHIGTIVIGRNTGWKQNAAKGNITNQNFVSVPFRTLIDMIRYKAELEGIKVEEINESYTSGTSYLDEERPDKDHYDKRRRVHRGLFQSNSGKLINADVNAAYQIMAKAGYPNNKFREPESIRTIKVA